MLQVSSARFDAHSLDDAVRARLALTQVESEARACSQSDRFASCDDSGSRQRAKSVVIDLDLDFRAHLSPLYSSSLYGTIPRPRDVFGLIRDWIADDVVKLAADLESLPA